MSEQQATRIAVDIGQVSVRGLAQTPPHRGAGLGTQVQAALQRLAGADAIPAGARSIALDRLSLRLPAGAGEAQLAETLARAIRAHWREGR